MSARGKRYHYGQLIREEIPALNGWVSNNESLKIVWDYIQKLKEEINQLKKEAKDGKEESSQEDSKENL